MTQIKPDCCGRLSINKNDSARIEAFLPTECVQNHAANLLPLPNGDLLCTWFGGTQEGIADISAYYSRLKKGSQTWTKAVKLSNDATRSEQNPLFFLAPDNVLWLLYTAQIAGNQDTAIVRYRQSHDFGETWGPIKTLLEDPNKGIFIRQPITVMPNGDWLLPVFYCIAKPGEKWVGSYDTSGVMISKDNGKTWFNVDVPDSLGCVHMNILLLKDNSLYALFRSRWADNIYASRSTDGGYHWSTPIATNLPNNNSSIQATVLNNGHIALVFNQSSAKDAIARRISLYDEIEDESCANKKEAEIIDGQKNAFWGAPRAPMSLAISMDNGETWPYIRHLDEGDGYCMTNNSKDSLNREFSYPTIKQGLDGKLHIAYTYFRMAIKYVVIDENWVKNFN
ncbi:MULTISPECIES: sialidase family protein [unclassified Gilliamella]|uniref:sialidase family protein n=1 Tax=unclassified Gilliamella TaxID=2685620 RepID=UPI00226986CE|nr:MULTISPECIES: exo-alpha-sialidase [unclassified Gilliamella]MCX8600758.1 exo-alpha-sialidase [Gilliamella sp. B3722]MCX8608087.1 exo-alpha-sialidase [Gilliamella sp. B3771]MCX8609978.1 exo-alpha-sialidase [Gilliamella sp. B3891]MCX8611932.1 exo-alpha-sialidase [Gilliamella sp. B3773]MCX8615292.1 exo-alpha-sialidase [Gilliamella sp. B3770]